MDNLPAHKVAAARTAIKERGAWLLFLPPYPPDFNPAEPAFSRLNPLMTRLAPGTVEGVCKSAGLIHRNIYTAFSQKILEILATKGKPKIESGSILDDRRYWQKKAVPSVST